MAESPTTVPDRQVRRPVDWRTLRCVGCENLVFVERLESTNSLARRVVAAALDGGGVPRPLLVVADEQTAGRGRGDRHWMSAAGLGVYASLVLSLTDPRQLQSLPLLAGIGLSRAMGGWLTVQCRLKWPNDLLIDGRKIGGIRVDSVQRGDLVVAIVGFGVNWGQVAAELPATVGATSLWLERRRSGVRRFPTLAQMTLGLVDGLTAAFEHLGDTGYAADAFEELAWTRPGTVISFHAGSTTVRGTFLGLDGDGLLRLAVGGVERRFAAGEVSMADRDPRRVVS